MNRLPGPVYTPDETMEAAMFFNEQAVVADARKGDREAFGALVRAYQRKVYVTAYGLVGNREDALELAQEAFVRAFRAMHRFDPGMPFYPWLHRIVRNACFNHQKKKRRHGETSLEALAASGHDVASPVASADRTAGLGELRERLSRGLAALSAEHREILVLRHFQELSYAEIALCLGIPQGTVMSRLHAARRALRHEVEGVL